MQIFCQNRYFKINILKLNVDNFGNDHRVAAISTMSLIVTRISQKSFDLIGRFEHA